MTGFVAVGAKYLEISRMITTTFGQRQDVMTVALSQFNWLATVLARAFVALVNPLTKNTPLIYGQSAIPLEAISQTFYIEVVHTLKNLTIPRHSTPYPTLPHRTGTHNNTPFRTSTTNEGACLALPYRTPPRRAAQRLASPCQTTAHRAKPQPQINHLARPSLCLPSHTPPCHASPDPARPIHTTTTKLFDNLKLRDHEATKLGAEVANANSLAGELQNIVDDFGRDLIVNHFNAELKLPAGFESRAESHLSRPLNHDWPHVDIQRLVCIGIQLIRHSHAMRNFVGCDKHVALKQVFVRLASLAGDLETTSGLDHCTLKVCRWLINLAVGIGVEVILPLRRIVNRTSGLAPTFANCCKIGHRVTMLQQWGNTLNLDLNRIHLRDSLKQNPAPLPDCELSRLTCRSKGAGLCPQSILFDKQKTTRESLDKMNYMANILNRYEVQSWQCI